MHSARCSRRGVDERFSPVLDGVLVDDCTLMSWISGLTLFTGLGPSPWDSLGALKDG
jgi:hypothetical protein